LVVAGEYPWPVNSGSRLRLLTVLQGLRRCGPTELFSVLPRVRIDIDPPDPGVDLARVGWVGVDDRPRSGTALLRSILQLATPLELPLQGGPDATRELVRFATGRYDLIWYFGVRPWALVGGLEATPTVVDLVDLEDRKIAARMSIPRPSAGGPLARLRRSGANALSAEEMRRWRRLQRGAAAAASATVVCSDLDAVRAVEDGLLRVSVVANGYPRPARPVGAVNVGSPPTILFQGTLRYPPNAEAARYLVNEVLPKLARRMPDIEVRLVGVSTPALEELDDQPQVSVVGRVADITDELARADLVVVPIRFGSGTRLKILEAFAHRIPVVSTTLGAEGLGVTDGEHLLLADDASAMASAVERLLVDFPLRESCTAAAHRLFLDRYEEELIKRRVADVARQVAGA